MIHSNWWLRHWPVVILVAILAGTMIGAILELLVQAVLDTHAI